MKYAQIDPTNSAVQRVLGWYLVADGEDQDGLEYPNLPASNALVEMTQAQWNARLTNSWYDPAGKTFVEPLAATPTQAELNAEAATAVQAWLDGEAQSFQYSTIESAVSYVGSTVDLWNRQGVAFKSWRDSVCQSLFRLQSSVAAGTEKQPATTDALIASLPQPNIPSS